MVNAPQLMISTFALKPPLKWARFFPNSQEATPGKSLSTLWVTEEPHKSKAVNRLGKQSTAQVS